MNDERGFMPFSLAGFFILMLVLAMVSHGAWSRHQQTIGAIEDVTCASLLTTAASIQSDLQHLSRYAVYQALWEVCKRADYCDNDESRERMVELLAAEHFVRHLIVLPQAHKHLDASVELEFPGLQLSFESFPSLDFFFDLLNFLSAWPSFELRQVENGYASVKVRLPRQTRIIVSSWDNRTVLVLPCENFEVFIDCRYFLLQERMGKFIRDFDDIRSSWKWAEYAAAWGQALAGQVKFSKSRSKTIFKLAWANHELETFGSADYPAAAMELADLDVGAIAGLTSDIDVTIKPISASDVRAMIGYIDSSIQTLEMSRAELMDVERRVRRAKDDIRENSCPEENLDAKKHLLENIREELDHAITGVDRALDQVREVQHQFQLFINFVASKCESNVIMLQLYDGLTTPSGSYPAPVQRISLGVEGVESKLMELRGQIDAQMQQIQSSDEIRNLENSLSQLHDYIKVRVQGLLTEPTPRYQESYEEYPNPSAYDLEEDPSPTTQNANIYIIERDDGTINTLDATLEDVKTSLGEMEDVAGSVEREQNELSGAEIDEELMQMLLEVSYPQSEQPAEFDRGQLYELLPPTPIMSQPGLSVFHEFDIKDVEYRRIDPCGRLGGASAPPTPIPLWFIGLTLYWGQWEVTLELEDEPIEQIFDYPNPTLPRPLLEGAGIELAKIHKSLGYRFELPRTRFSFTLLIISPRYFNIGAYD